MCCHLVEFFQVPLDPTWLGPQSKLMESSKEYLIFLPRISRIKLSYICWALDAITSQFYLWICSEYYIDPFIFCQMNFSCGNLRIQEMLLITDKQLQRIWLILGLLNTCCICSYLLAKRLIG